MWLQARLYILVGLMFAILYGILVGIGYYLHISGFMFYLLIIGVARVCSSTICDRTENC